MQANGYAALAADKPLEPFSFKRREPGDAEILIDVAYCGMCHSDVHSARNEWRNAKYPMVPGHEIVGKVSKVGPNAKKFKIGDIVGVGCMVGSCRSCSDCKENEEQMCKKCVLTYNSKDYTGEATQGGYSNIIVVPEDFVLSIPEKLQSNLAAVAPLLCAGITTYSPLRRYQADKSKTVGVIGLGGLGHMAVKLAHSMGSKTVLFTRSEHKVDEAKHLGADEVCNSKDEESVKKFAGSCDLIIDTVSAVHDIGQVLSCVKKGGHLVLVGAPEKPAELNVFSLGKHKSLHFSMIGGVKETQEMLDYCGAHSVFSEIEIVPIQKVNEAFDRMVKSDVKYRFVIDMKTNTVNKA